MTHTPSQLRTKAMIAFLAIVALCSMRLAFGAAPQGKSPVGDVANTTKLRIPTANLVIVRDDQPSEAMQLALDAFVARAKFLGGAPAKVVAAKDFTAADAAGRTVLIVGMPETNSQIKKLLGEELKSTLGAKPDFAREQGYVIELSGAKSTPNDLTIAAGALGKMGSVYAISDLEMHLACVDGKSVLVLDDMAKRFASMADAKRSAKRVEAPSIPERGEYLNFSGTPDRYVLPIGWEKEEWEQHIDRCVKARLTFVSVYIWSSQVLAAAENDEQKAELSRMHDNVLHGLRYAHKRGLKFKYLFTPSTVPEHIYKKAPADYRAPTTVYDWPAFKLLNPGAVAKIKEIYRPQIEMFKEADAFHIFFFDPGGDFTPEFVADWGKNMSDHIVDFEQLIHEISPNAQIEFNLWNADLFAERYKPFAEDLMSSLRDHYGEKTSEMSVFCSPKYAPLAKKLGFKTERFLFETNHERAYVFFTPQFPRNFDETRELYPLFDSTFCHRVEVGSKFPNTFICASWFWNQQLSIGEILDRYGLWAVGPDAKDDLAAAIMTLDRITFDPGNLVFARELRDETRRAEAKTAPQVREQMEWLFTSLYGTATLADLAAAKTPEEQQKYERELYTLLEESRMFRPSLEKWIKETGQAPKWAQLITVGNRFSGF